VRHFSADFKRSLKLSTAGSFNFRERLISPRERAVNREFLKKTRIKISNAISVADFKCSLIFNYIESESGTSHNRLLPGQFLKMLKSCFATGL